MSDSCKPARLYYITYHNFLEALFHAWNEIFSVLIAHVFLAAAKQHDSILSHITPRELRRDPSNRRLNEHGIYIRHCQESNSQPVPSQAGADTTMPQ